MILNIERHQSICILIYIPLQKIEYSENNKFAATRNFDNRYLEVYRMIYCLDTGFIRCILLERIVP